MLDSPFQYETWLTHKQYQKLGELSLRWSHIDHMIGNSLGKMLKLSDEQAVIMVFPLSTVRRLEKINKLAKVKRINKDAQAALKALSDVMKHLVTVRNSTIHAIMIEDDEDGAVLHLRSNKRTLTIEQVFSTEELTNYAAHAALSLRYALGGEIRRRHPLPEKPDVPDFLTNPPPTAIRVGRPLPPRQ